MTYFSYMITLNTANSCHNSKILSISGGTMSKSKRLIELMMRVNERKKFTVQELADEFNVSYRTMLRDLQELCELGVPLYSEVGVHGGYHLLKEKEIPDLLNSMNHINVGTVITKEEFKVIGLEFTAPYSIISEADVLIPRLWFKLIQRIEEIPNIKDRNIRLGVVFHQPLEIRVIVSYEVENNEFIPDGMVSITVPQRNYVKYPHRGNMDRQNIKKTFNDALEWCKKKGLEPDLSFGLELYDSRFIPTSKDNEFDFFIPILATSIG